MNDLLDQIQCDEADEPTQADWVEFAEYCDELDRRDAEAELTATMSISELQDYFFNLGE